MPRLLGQTLQAQISRTYHVSVPDNPLQATVPAIVVFHGGGQDAQTIARRWGVDPANPAVPPPSPLDRYLLVFPEADPRLGDEWVHFKQGVSPFPTFDLLFVDRLLRDITAAVYSTGNVAVPSVTVDRGLVYAAGFSNGGGMVWQLMNSDLVSSFRGFAAVGKALDPEKALHYRGQLGVGVSHHAAIEAMHGIPYERPAAHLREYLAVLVPLLSEGRVDVEGEHYRVHAEITVPGTAPVSVVVGALSPLMAGVAGAGSDGIVTWLAGPRTLEQVLVPAVTAAASGAGRPAPRIVAALPVAVADEAAARATADVTFARYGTLPNYQRVFAREGVTAPGELAVVGDEHAVEQQLRRHAALGATEFWPIAFPVGDDPDASLARTTQLLASLAPEL